MNELIWNIMRKRAEVPIVYVRMSTDKTVMQTVVSNNDRITLCGPPFATDNKKYEGSM